MLFAKRGRLNTPNSLETDNSKEAQPSEVVVKPESITALEAVAKTLHNKEASYNNNEYLAGEYTFETSEVLKNPATVGINVASLIVDGRMGFLHDYQQDGQLPQAWQYADAGAINNLARQQTTRMSKYRQYIESFGGQLEHARLHTSALASPLSPGNAIRDDGSVCIAPEFIDQIKLLQDTGVKDIAVTAEYYTSRYDRDGTRLISHLYADNNSNNNVDGLPAGAERQDYLNMIIGLIEQSSAAGVDINNLTIELGNETNQTIKTDFDDGSGALMSGVYADPVRYAEFYRSIASQLKDKYPSLKLAVAGTAGADVDYLRTVLDWIGDDSLVDAISSHPYRSSPDSESWVIDKQHSFNNSDSYPVAEDKLIQLARQHGASYSVGEIAYSQKQPDELAHANLDDDLSRSSGRGVVTCMWPRAILGH